MEGHKARVPGRVWATERVCDARWTGMEGLLEEEAALVFAEVHLLLGGAD